MGARRLPLLDHDLLAFCGYRYALRPPACAAAGSLPRVDHHEVRGLYLAYRWRSDVGTCIACGDKIEFLWSGQRLRYHLNPDYYLCRGSLSLPQEGPRRSTADHAPLEEAGS